MSEEGPINVFVVDVQENEYEVDKVVGVAYCMMIGVERTLFRIRWSGYNWEHDTWEPMENMGNCQQRVAEFMDLDDAEKDIREERDEFGNYIYIAYRKNLIE